MVSPASEMEARAKVLPSEVLYPGFREQTWSWDKTSVMSLNTPLSMILHKTSEHGQCHIARPRSDHLTDP